MAYSAFEDAEKTKLVSAKGVSINKIRKTYYCKTLDCKAHMSLVNGADTERAYFRRLPSSPRHSSLLCAADGYFDSTEYEEDTFSFEDIANKIIKPSNVVGYHGTGNGIVTGGGGKKSISTVMQIYLMCRKYDVYNGIRTNEILADERSFDKYKDGITGKKIVQGTVYHKVKDEFSFIMNYPLFPFRNRRYVRIDFDNKKLFWEFYNKVKTSDHKEPILILGDWTLGESDEDYIARCTIYKSRQYHFPKFEL